MPRTTTKAATKQTTRASIIKELEAFVKAYYKQKQAQEELDRAKKVALRYLKSKINKYDKLKYKTCYLTLCDRNTYSYSEIVDKMTEATKKQKKIEELNGEATLKTSTDYIRLDKIR